MFDVLKIKKARALCWLDDETLLLFKKHFLFSYNIATKSSIKICPLSLTLKQSIFSHFSLTRRLLRLYPMAPAINYVTNELFFSFQGAVYSFDLNNKTISKEIDLNHGASRVLNICVCNNGDVLFGEYPTKKDEKPILIYKREKKQKWKGVYSFKPNAIRHIHLLKEYQDDIYCFTGDENKETKILCFKNGDFNVEPTILASGNQTFRTCVATFNDNKLYYVTDNPYFENGLYSFDLLTGTMHKIFAVEGSVIYGLDSNDSLFFSTAVEKNLMKDSNGENVVIKIDGKNGGIRSKNVYLYHYKIDKQELIKIAGFRKDFYSIKYFGLGSFVFPCNSSDKYLATSLSSIKPSEATLCFPLKSEVL